MPHPRFPDHLVCFSHLRWNFVFQRPQHLMTRAAKTARVIFIEEPIVGDGPPGLQVEKSQGVTVVTPLVRSGDGWLSNGVADLLDKLSRERTIAWYYTPLALDLGSRLQPELTVYDCMDELSAFKFAPPALKKAEAELMGRADVVFTGGQSLFDAKKALHRNVYAFPSSVDAKHFNQARSASIEEPADQRSIPGPRLGYFGVVDERLDLDLVAAVADAHPEWSIVMIGPVVKIDPATLPRRPNIHWLGGKDYKELPAYLSGWNVGIMPFAINEATRFISPTKTPEYLAAGRKVVSTAITDVVHPYADLGIVDIGATAREFVRCCERALNVPTEAWLDAVDDHLADMSWDRTWRGMRSKMQSAYGARTGGVQQTPPLVNQPTTEERRHVRV